MSEMIENKLLALQKEVKMSIANQSRKKVASRKRMNVSPGIIVGCFELNRLILI
jgi:hypothetical protein